MQLETRVPQGETRELLFCILEKESEWISEKDLACRNQWIPDERQQYRITLKAPQSKEKERTLFAVGTQYEELTAVEK